MNETVVTFKNADRTVAMYIRELEDGELDLQMSVDPELKEEESPDLPLLLAHALLSALKGEKQQEVYAGQD